ncbi:hypothetical protein CC79DRAFT_1362157 [Sarocladium strictum]
MSTYGSSSSHTQIPPHSSVSGTGPTATIKDFSYITSQDLDGFFLDASETRVDAESQSLTTGKQIQDVQPVVPQIDGLGGRENSPPNALHRLRTAKHYAIPSLINGVPAEAYCDAGSNINVMSETFVFRHNFKLDRSNTSKFRLPNALITRAVGTTRTKYQFRDEQGYHDVLFHVFATCPDDVILGNSFLKLSGTLQNNNKHRIRESYRPCLLSDSRLFFISATYSACHEDSAKRLLPCYVKGQSCEDALQESGSDLVVMSGSYARGCNFQIDVASRAKVCLADGSTIRTDGMVWDAGVEFASTVALDLDSYLHNIESLESWLSSDERSVTSRDHGRSIVICDLHVAEGLSCDVTLSARFLMDIGLLSQEPINKQLPQNGRWSRDVFALEGLENKFRSRLKKRINDWKSKTPSDSTSQVGVQQLALKMFEPEIAKRDAEDRIIRMTPAEQKQAAVEAALKRRGEWEDSQRLADRLQRSLSKPSTAQGSSDSTANTLRLSNTSGSEQPVSLSKTDK